MRVAIALLIVSSSAFAAPRFEKTPTPPRVFDGIRAGMTRAALEGWQVDASYEDAARRVRLVKEAGGGARYYVLLVGDVVARIGLEAPARGLVARLEKLWGRSTASTNFAGEAISSWARGGWRVDLSCRGERCRLAFHEALAPAYFGTQVGPPGVLAKLRPGMTKDELAALSPRHVARSPGGVAPAVPAGPEDVNVTVELADSGHVRAVLVAGLPANAREILEHAWGASLDGDDGRTWFDPARGWRATLLENLRTLQLTGYIPAAKILGGGPGLALFDKPLLGATRAQVGAAYPMARADGQKLVIDLPPSEGGIGKCTLVFDPVKQRVKSMTIELPYDSATRRDELLKLMSAKWGTPKPKAAVLVFPTDPVSIEVVDGAKRLDVRIALL